MERKRKKRRDPKPSTVEYDNVKVNGVVVRLPRKPLLTVRQVVEAGILPSNARGGNVDRWGVYDRIENGWFPDEVLTRMGWQYLFRRDKLIEFLEGRAA